VLQISLPLFRKIAVVAKSNEPQKKIVLGLLLSGKLRFEKIEFLSISPQSLPKIFWAAFCLILNWFLFLRKRNGFSPSHGHSIDFDLQSPKVLEFYPSGNLIKLATRLSTYRKRSCCSICCFNPNSLLVNKIHYGIFQIPPPTIRD